MTARDRILVTALGFALAACTDDSTGAGGSSGGSGGTGGATDSGTTSAGPTSGPTSGSGPGTDETGTAAATGTDTTTTGGGTGPTTTGGVIEGCVVPDDYESIQAGVDDRMCTTLFVQPGTYVENVVIGPSAIVQAIEAIEAGTVTVDGDGAGRVFDIDAVNPVTLDGLTITGGDAATGAGVHSVGDLALASCVVEVNTASEGSAGIYGEATVDLVDSTVQDNAVVATDVDVYGGGVHAVGAAHLTSCLVTNNTVDLVLTGMSSVGVGGGGVLADAGLVIDGASEVSGNSITIAGVNGSGGGAGVLVYGDFTLGTGGVIADNAIAVSTGGEIAPAQAFGGGLLVLQGTVAITGATVSGNSITTDSYAGIAHGGGAYTALGSVTVTDSTFSGNTTSMTTAGAVSLTRGGGMYVEGDLLVQTSAFDANSATGIGGPPPPTVEGGGIYITGPFEALDSTFEGNGAYGGAAHGAAIAAADGVGDTVQLRRCTLSTNEAVGTSASGGGLWVHALAAAPASTTVRLVNSTVSGNLADGPVLSVGGGVALQVAVGSAGEVHLASCTLTLNDAGPSTPAAHGGGLWTQLVGAEAFVHNTIVAGNSATQSPDCSTAALFSAGYNLIEDVTDCAIAGGPDVLGVDPALAALAANGGPTQTHAVVAGTPPVDAGDPSGCTDTESVALTTDQRGDNREVGAACDIGAFELQ